MERIKIKWKVTKQILMIASLFWALETIYFIIVYGWHISPINENEKMCDNIALYAMYVGVFMFTIVLADIVDYLLTPVNKAK